MELGADILTPALLAVGGVVFTLGLVVAAWGAPWSWLGRGEIANRFGATCVAVLMIWQLRAELDGGPAVHLLGATLMTLAFGWRLAIIGLSAVLILCAALTTGDLLAIGVNGTLSVLLGVGSSYGFARAVEKAMPQHLFVYIFFSAFFGAAVTVAVVAYAALMVAQFAGEMNAFSIAQNYRPTALLLLFPEAFITGALVTLAAVYRPAWLVSFNERRYLSGNGDTRC